MNLLNKYKKGIEEIERWYTFDDNGELLKIAPLVRNGKFLLLGPYGFGKSLYAYLTGRVFFGYSEENMPVVQLMNELSVNDVFFKIDVARLIKGEEKIAPRDIVTAPFKFVNEFQRGNHRIYNTFLGLFEEGFVTIRDTKFKTKDYVAILDANPFDSGSVEVPAALMDRITASVNMRTVPGNKMLEMMSKPVELNKVKKVMTPREMSMIWNEVNSVAVPEKQHLLLTLIHGYMTNCIYGDKAVMDYRYIAHTCESCRYRTEPCAMLKEPLGHRWWKDALRVAKAKAYYDGRNEVSSDDVLFAAKYVLQHRIQTHERLRALYSSKEEWVNETLKNAKIRLKTVWLPALRGDKESARKDERTLSFIGELDE